MKRIAVIDGGTSYHHRVLYGDRFASYFSQIIYAGDLQSTKLEGFDALIVPDRTHPGLLRSAKENFAQYLSNGGTLVALGETQCHTWLPRVSWQNCLTNFWWWKTPGSSLGLYLGKAEHPLFQYLTLEQATWHYHGVFDPPPGSQILIGVEGEGAILYEDSVSTGGTMIISALDPFFHYGSYFMPITESFLDSFLKWLKDYKR